MKVLKTGDVITGKAQVQLKDKSWSQVSLYAVGLKYNSTCMNPVRQ